MWDETVRIMNDLFDNVWGDRSEVVVDHCVDTTLPVSPHGSHFAHVPTSPLDCPLRRRRRRYFIPVPVDISF